MVEMILPSAAKKGMYTETGIGLNKKKLATSYFPAEGSIIGVRELDFRVRNGNGYYLSTMVTSIFILI